MAIDRNKIEQAIKLFLEGIGEDPNREGLKDTPKRVAKMWEEFESYREMNMTVFEEVGSYEEMVVVRDIQFYSLCEHHLLPFFGKAHVAYIPDKKVCGISKIVRVVNKFAYRPQVQERLTAEIAEYLEKELQPKGVAVVMEATHLCYSSDTEILTDKGWKLFKDLNPDDKVAQVDKDGLIIEFVEPLDYIKYPFKGYMINFKSKSLDLLVSPDHRVLFSSNWNFYKSKNRYWKTAPAYTLVDKSKFVIPQAGILEGKNIDFIKIPEDYVRDSSEETVITKVKTVKKIKGNTFLKFIGIYLARGSLYRNSTNSYTVRITLNEEWKAQKVESILKEMPYSYSKHTKENGVIEFRINSKGLYIYLYKLGKGADRHIPSEIFNSSVKQRKLFLEYFIIGNGQIKKDGKSYRLVSKSKKLVDDIQAIFLSLGVACNVYEIFNKKSNSTHYYIETRYNKRGDKKNYSMVTHVENVEYNDYIYSVTVPSGYILVRRNGKPAISGNCMAMRGVRNPESVTVTSKLTGKFLECHKTREEFLNLINSHKKL